MSWKTFDTEGRLLINDGSGGGVCAPVLIIDIVSGIPIAVVASGGTYSVAVFSGINGGTSNTVYTNSIVAP